MKKFIKSITAFLFVLAIPFFSLTAIAMNQIPDSFSVSEGTAFRLHTEIPVTLNTGAQEASSIKGGGEYQAQVKLFGVTPVKEVSVGVVEPSYVIPCGTPFGLRMFTNGVLVVGMSDVDTEQGAKNPAVDAGLQIGDLILSIDGVRMTSNQLAADTFEQSQGKPLDLLVERDGTEFHATLTTLYSVSCGDYKAGLWIRDSSAGIGTMTYVDPSNGMFAGLGHGVCDVDTGEVVPISSGDVMHVELMGITKGVRGQAGELKGYFSSTQPDGCLLNNNETGVYGVLNSIPKGDCVPVAMKQEVQKGKAQILATVENGQTQYYDIEIEKVSYKEDQITKNMIIRITDQALLEKTGGIVQGMSGSPIIQNGKLVGAVTHVFVNDPTKGYAIFAENMITTEQQVQQENQKKIA